jgi:hypothetical protein
MICEMFDGCPFYNMRLPIESGLGQLYKKNYCEGDKTLCARYKIVSAIGKECVPADLYPNMRERADIIIKEHKTETE